MPSCMPVFFFSSRRRHTRFKCDWSSDVCSSDLQTQGNDPLRFLDEDRGGQEQRIFEKAKATFDPTLLLVGRHQFLIREHLALQFIGADNEASLARHFLVEP